MQDLSAAVNSPMRGVVEQRSSPVLRFQYIHQRGSALADAAGDQ